VVTENALEALVIARARSLASLLWRAESAEMPIAGSRLREMLGEGVFGEALLARDWRCADVEH